MALAPEQKLWTWLFQIADFKLDIVMAAIRFQI
jgi:hypothetical protein